MGQPPRALRVYCHSSLMGWTLESALDTETEAQGDGTLAKHSDKEAKLGFELESVYLQHLPLHSDADSSTSPCGQQQSLDKDAGLPSPMGVATLGQWR